MLLLAAMAHCATFIVPVDNLNHRITFQNGPKIINNSVSRAGNDSDHFDFPRGFTYLNSSGFALCRSKGALMHVCPTSDASIVWKIENIRREVRFKDAHGNCLTKGGYNPQEDSYDVVSKPCSQLNSGQVFILNEESPIAAVAGTQKRNFQ